ncbi:MAG: hypothetical protein HOO95_03610 [Gallionella sp.]|nr:hypothetical protein [Gallionella sp.]
MTKVTINCLVACIMTVLCLSVHAEGLNNKPAEKFVGKWDNHAGIISFFVNEIKGAKRARMLAVAEHVEDETSKISIGMSVEELDELEELVESAIHDMGNPDTLPVPPLNAKEVTNTVGSAIYANGKLTLSIVDPAGTKRYASLVLKTSDRSSQYDFWMDKPDLVQLKRLLDKTLLELGES